MLRLGGRCYYLQGSLHCIFLEDFQWLSIASRAVVSSSAHWDHLGNAWFLSPETVLIDLEFGLVSGFLKAL